MKARWYGILAAIFIFAGFFIPYLLLYLDMQNSNATWGDIAWIIVAPAVYSYISIAMWLIAFILFIVAILKWKRR